MSLTAQVFNWSIIFNTPKKPGSAEALVPEVTSSEKLLDFDCDLYKKKQIQINHIFITSI
jgi:hypothetical protein